MGSKIGFPRSSHIIIYSGFKEAGTAAQNAQAVIVVVDLDAHQEKYVRYIGCACSIYITVLITL